MRAGVSCHASTVEGHTLLPRSRVDPTRVTIQAVAKRAGVSAMTVSNVYNGRGKTSTDTRDRVLRIIREMGYVPSQAARRLVGVAAARIGLIYYEYESPFYDAAVSGISIAMAERGLQLLVHATQDAGAEHLLEAGRSLIRSGADALLLVPPFAEVLAASGARQELGVPLVALATAAPLPDVATVRIDNRAAMRAMTRHLIDRGYRRIAFVAGPDLHSDSVARVNGYLDALASAGLHHDPGLMEHGGFSLALAQAAGERLLALPDRPDAIMAASDDMAAGVMMAAHRAGLEVPRDLAITGFDDNSIAKRLCPALTTVRQPVQEMARSSVALLAQALGGQAYAQDVVLDFALVERDTVRRLAV
jgi:LacI family transcriptional regulator